MPKRGKNGSARSEKDRKFIRGNAVGPNTNVSSLGSVKGQDHLSQAQIKRMKGYKNA